MAKKWKDLKGKMSAEARSKVDQRVKESLAEMPLHKLRQALKMSQTRLGEILDVPQSSISKIEHQADMYVSTLRSYIEALGGELEIMAKMPDGNVRITRFEAIEEEHRKLVEA